MAQSSDMLSQGETMSRSNRTLSRSTLSQALGEDEFATIERRAKRVTFRPNEIIFLQDDSDDALYIVEEGRIEISVTSASGKKLTLNEMRAGDVFGEIASLDGSPRTATATSLSDSVLARISGREFRECLRANGNLGAAIIEILCTRLRWVNQQVRDLALHDIEGRLASRLLLLDERFADEAGVLHISQNELADFIGGTRESTNKLLRQWQQKGLIELSRRSIRVHKRDALANMSVD